jgi:hypothetical protein
MNNPDHISDSFETLGFGSGMEKIGMRFKHPGSTTSGDSFLTFTEVK